MNTDREPTQAERLLYDLAAALNNATISSWQTTAAWQLQLDSAIEYLEREGMKV